jgi:formate transporter
MKHLQTLALGVLAGLFIGLGSFAYCACVSLDASVGKILGSLLFSVGLFLVCFFSANLYTGKIGFCPDCFKDKGIPYLLELAEMLAGNFIGASGSGALLYLALGSDNKIVKVAQGIAASRTLLGEGAQSWYKALIMGVFCGILVFLAVYCWKQAENWFIKASGLILCVTTFVVTGTEHCIANMFYYALAGSWNFGLTLDVLLVILGNSIGSLLLFYLFKVSSHKTLAK